MNIRDFIVPVTLALVTTWAIQYFFLSDKSVQEQTSDRSFVAPLTPQSVEPLDFDIDFVDSKPISSKLITEVNIPNVIYSFSNEGAIIEKAEYKRNFQGKEGTIETILPSNSKEKGAFLLALNGIGNTPYYYNLVENKTDNNITTLVYKADTNSSVILKEFKIYHNTYQIDLKITVEPKNNAELRARLFYPAPLISDNKAADVVTAVMTSSKQSVEKKALKDIAQLGKEKPSIFGLEDRYFINVLIKDAAGFASRAYYKLEGTDNAEAVLQSIPFKEKTTWDLSFYVGPKESAQLDAVDVRLEAVLDYGWLAPISRMLLYLLNFFYSILKNYGFAIIALTVFIRLLMVPFTLRAQQNQKKHLEAQKKLKYIEQKHKNDPEMLARAKADFAREQGIPGLLGCLPLLLQIPVFIGLNRILTNSIQLYKAPFIGWIHDLSQPDPYYVLPALVFLGMVLQPQTSFEPRQRIVSMILAVIVAALVSNFSAGLTLYIAVSTLLGVGQTAIQKALKI